MIDIMASQVTGLAPISSSPDIRLFYSVDGPLDGSRKIVVLSNSLAATTRLWDDFTAHFSGRYTVIRYDARFHGRSPLSTNKDFDYVAGHSMEDLADDLITLLDHMNVEHISLAIGLSIGAGVVLIAGAKQPSRFGHVLVVGTKAQPPSGADAAYDDRIAFGRSHGSLALGQQSVRRWFPEAWIKENPQKAATVEEIVGGQDINGFIANVAALRRLNLWPAAHDISARADGSRFTFVAGEQDGDIPEDSRLLAKAANSKVLIIENAGHIVHIQQPQEFYSLVESVLNGS